MFNFSKKYYNELKEELIHILSEDNSLSYQDVIENLKNNGYKEILEDIFDKKLYLHAGFVKPETDNEIVLEAWNEIWEIGLK